MRTCLDEGQVLLCDVVWAEACAAFPHQAAASEALDALGVTFDALDRDAASAAAEAWRRYRKAGGPRTRVIADFLIGAHAVSRADRLLTRDRSFYRRYFTGLDIVDPSQS